MKIYSMELTEEKMEVIRRAYRALNGDCLIGRTGEQLLRESATHTQVEARHNLAKQLEVIIYDAYVHEDDPS